MEASSSSRGKGSLTVNDNTLSTMSNEGSVRLSREGSAVLRVDDDTRRMHLASLLPVTRPQRGAFKPLESRFYYIAGGYLAMQHFNERSNLIISDLSDRLQDCDLQMSIEYRDTQFNRVGGARVLNEVLARWPNNTLQDPFPSAIVGSGRSDTSETVSTLSGMFQLPMVSPHSSAASLDDKGRFPYFARTTPSAAYDGKAAVDYMHHMKASHVGVIYVLDTLGIAYDEVIQKEARALGMTVYSVPYRFTDGEEEMRQAFQRLKATGVRYIFAAIEPATWKQFIRVAVEEEIIGNPDFFWLFHSGMVGLVPEEMDEKTEYEIVRAVHGSGVVLKDFPPNPTLDNELIKLETDQALQKDFVSLWSDPEQFDDFSFRYPGPNYPQYINYDSVMALGLAACSIEKEYFTGNDLYSALVKNEFAGASDYVSFDSETGSRRFVRYRVDNILMVNKGEGILGFRQEPTAEMRVDGVELLEDFLYWDNTTQAPPPLPPLQVEFNYIPVPLQGVGIGLGCSIMILSMLLIGWTFYYKKRDVVKSSQPFFLIQLCIGTFFMAGSIIPMSFQEPTSLKGLNVSCMLVPWLFVVGFVVAFAALLSKSWRINKLFSDAAQFKRVQVRIVDAIFPLLILMTINVVLLLLWTFLSPLRWERVQIDNFDRFDRSRESYGTCKTDGSVESRVFFSLILAVNALGLVVSNYQGYRTRNLPTAFDESFYVAMTNAMLLEAFILGFPVLILVHDNPSASFIVKAILVSVVCLCILLPVFVPKHLRRNTKATREEQTRRSTNLPMSSIGSESIAGCGSSTTFISGLKGISAELGHQGKPEQQGKELCGSRIVRRAGPEQQAETPRQPKLKENRPFCMSMTPNSWGNADLSGASQTESSIKAAPEQPRLFSLQEESVKDEASQEENMPIHGEETSFLEPDQTNQVVMSNGEQALSPPSEDKSEEDVTDETIIDT